MSTILTCGNSFGKWDNIKELLQTKANNNFIKGRKMTIKGMVCGKKEGIEKWL